MRYTVILLLSSFNLNLILVNLVLDLSIFIKLSKSTFRCPGRERADRPDEPERYPGPRDLLLQHQLQGEGQHRHHAAVAHRPQQERGRGRAVNQSELRVQPPDDQSELSDSRTLEHL